MGEISRKWRLPSGLLAGAVLMSMLPLIGDGAAAKQEVGVDTYTIDDSRNDQLHPRIDGDIVVWQDYREVGAHTTDSGNADIYAYDLGRRDEYRVTGNRTGSRPDVSGEVVVFADSRNGDLDIRGYNVRTDDEYSLIRRAGSDQDRPAVDGDIVVWQDDREGDWDIRGSDVNGDNEFWVSRREGNQINPRISGRNVVWEDDRDGCCDIYLRNIDSGSVTRVTDSNDAHEPDISGDRIVYRRGDGDRTNIYVYSIGTGESARVNTTRDDARGAPSINGRLVVWADRRNGEDYNIQGYDLDTGSEFVIIRSDGNQLEPVVSGNRVVWADFRSAADIRGANLTLASLTPTPTPSPTNGTRPPPVQGPCEYVLGFRFLRERIMEREGNIVGQCLENEWHNADNGDGLQRTSGRGNGSIGMFAWRKADNWTAFTDGYMTWLWGPCGLQKRLNTGPYFAWEGRLGAPCM